MSNNFFIDSYNTLNNRYKIIKFLGDSGKRITLMACDLTTKKLVVIKILIFNEEFRWEDLKLFEREAETLKFLCHVAIPKYIDYFDLNIPNFQGFALVQSYIEAQSLQEHLQTGRQFNQREIKQLAKSLIEVLNYLHSRQPAVIHRDIKPSNILLANCSAHSVGDVYLVDFGSVQTTVKQYGTRTVVGTYGYMPPEQFGGRVFPASDLYSLGATLIYLATKKHPIELLDDNLQIQIPSIKNFSNEFINWLNLMTHPGLKRRFNSASLALQALKNTSETLFIDNNFNQELFSSKIKVKRNLENIEIIFPLRITSFCGMVWFVYYNLMLICISLSALLFITLTINIGSIISLLTIFFLFYIYLRIFYYFLVKRCILINRNSINISNALLGIAFSSSEIAIQDNSKLLSTAKSSYKLVNLKNQLETIKSKSPDLIICTGTKVYKLRSLLNADLTKGEHEFIEKLISNWFNKPIIDIDK